MKKLFDKIESARLSIECLREAFSFRSLSWNYRCFRIKQAFGKA